jgi:beta-lactamase class A
MKLITIPLALTIATISIITTSSHQFNYTSSNSTKILAESPNLKSKTTLQVALNNLNISANQEIGIGVLDLNTGESWFRNRKQQFPMQSVYKLPIAIAILKCVDENKISLGQPVTITRQDFAPGNSPITKEINGNRAQFTVQDLLNRAVGISDNTASDALVRLIGGPSKVNEILGKLNIHNIRVDRFEQQIQPDSVGLKNPQPAWSDAKTFEAIIQQTPASVKQTALKKYLTDPRDTATPEGLVDLLAKLHTKQLLSSDSTALLLQIMTNSPSGQKRLKAGLPKNWSIAHKTGTGEEILGVGSATNDVGIISSPSGKQIAIAVLIPGSKVTLEERERLMANVAATVVQAN